MKDDVEVVRGSGNVFADLGMDSPALRQLKSILAAKIIAVLDRRKMSVREAHEKTRVAAADFSRIRQAKLDRFTVDRLMTILDRLGQKVDVSVSVHARRR
jgi:predicted XRE-type DNA-binding protein